MDECEERQARCRASIRELLVEKEKRYEAVLDAKEANHRAAFDEIKNLIANISNDMWPEDELKQKINDRIDVVMAGEGFQKKLKQNGKVSIGVVVSIIVVLVGWFGCVGAVWVNLASRITANEVIATQVLKEIKSISDGLNRDHGTVVEEVDGG